jgi:8-oxo-dGTP pyrophosphatase MutT (NUDIX family)
MEPLMIEIPGPKLETLATLAHPPARAVAAAVLVAEDGRYLLQLRDDKPGLLLADHWALFGGGLEPGETAIDGLRRELLEELGFEAHRVEPLAVSVHAVAPDFATLRMHFFTVPFERADMDRMVQTEGAGKGLFTLAEACALERVSPWDLCALLYHGRATSLFPTAQDN